MKGLFEDGRVHAMKRYDETLSKRVYYARGAFSRRPTIDTSGPFDAAPSRVTGPLLGALLMCNQYSEHKSLAKFKIDRIVEPADVRINKEGLGKEENNFIVRFSIELL